MAETPRFPKYDLGSCIAATRSIRQRAGGGLIASHDELATYLGYKSRANGAYLNRIAAMRLFGLMEGRGDDMRLTARALTILEPDYAAAAEQARLDAFFDIPLYAAFFARYGNGMPLPDDQGMRNALVNFFGVTDALAGSVLRGLLDSAEEAGLFRVAGARTKMIKPTPAPTATPTPTPAPPEDAPRSEAESTTFNLPVVSISRTTGPRASKIIDGALDLLPTESWSEEGLAQWLDFFETALRLYYSLPKPPKPQPSKPQPTPERSARRSWRDEAARAGTSVAELDAAQRAAQLLAQQAAATGATIPSGAQLLIDQMTKAAKGGGQ